ncbi:hypothetical protein DHEL01_v210121 [Diaporthe helianthi]|uniref:Uncharacterized protein n=1 Tax=Diaporthe helianthi TaxID=158607 RepID=A0A2P5HML5_DIAHE|nr:hypothetical protein DHEL01_v210121 [Diaporthe helianthi]
MLNPQQPGSMTARHNLLPSHQWRHALSVTDRSTADLSLEPQSTLAMLQQQQMPGPWAHNPYKSTILFLDEPPASLPWTTTDAVDPEANSKAGVTASSQQQRTMYRDVFERLETPQTLSTVGQGTAQPDCLQSANVDSLDTAARPTPENRTWLQRMVANIGERLGSLSVRADAHLGAIISDSDDDSHATAKISSAQVLFIPPEGQAAHVEMIRGTIVDEMIWRTPLVLRITIRWTQV